MGYRWNCLDKPIFMAGSKPMRTEFGICQRLECCEGHLVSSFKYNNDGHRGYYLDGVFSKKTIVAINRTMFFPKVPRWLLISPCAQISSEEYTLHKKMNNTKLMHNHLVSYMRRYLQKYDSYGKKGLGQEQPVIHSSRYSLLPRIE